MGGEHRGEQHATEHDAADRHELAHEMWPQNCADDEQKSHQQEKSA
jgi:hypothetical protein